MLEDVRRASRAQLFLWEFFSEVGAQGLLQLADASFVSTTHKQAPDRQERRVEDVAGSVFAVCPSECTVLYAKDDLCALHSFGFTCSAVPCV